MSNNFIDSKEITLNNERYIAYLKRVPIKVLAGGTPDMFCVRAFIRKLKN